LALEQNSRLTIAMKSLSAYQIHYDVLKNISGREKGMFAVD
jgi:hypothetical protein